MRELESTVNEFVKPKKIRKDRDHRNKIRFDDDLESANTRKQAGKKRHSRYHDGEVIDYGFEDDNEFDQIKHLIK